MALYPTPLRQTLGAQISAKTPFQSGRLGLLGEKRPSPHSQSRVHDESKHIRETYSRDDRRDLENPADDDPSP